MIRIDAPGILRMQADLKAFAHKALPIATQRTLNDTVSAARLIARDRIQHDFVNRNNFSRNSVQFTQAKRVPIHSQAAVVGSTVPWMADQEFGGSMRKTGKYGTVIPTSWAANQGSKIPRTRLPIAANKLANIKLRRLVTSGKTKTRRQDAFLRGLIAAKQGDKFVFIPGGASARSGIYRVWGTRKRNGKPTRIKLKMAYSMERGAVSIKPRPWLSPTVKIVQQQIPSIYKKALIFQMNRNNLFSRKFNGR